MFFFLTSNPLDAPVRWQTWCCPKETPGHLRTIVWSCHTYERSCHTYERPAAMTRPLANSPMSILDMTHSYVWHDSFICVTWFVYNVFIRLVLVDSFIHWVIWQCIILLMWHMTYAYVWHDSFLCVTWLTHMCHLTHSHVWNDTSIMYTSAWYWWTHLSTEVFDNALSYWRDT